LHASAFGLYLIAVVVYCVAQAIYFLYPDNPTLLHVYDYSILFYIWCSFLSVLLLAVIFWDFGRKVEPENEDPDLPETPEV